MQSLLSNPAVVVFLITLATTFVVSALGRFHGRHIRSQRLADQRLSKWLVGLSAGAAANSGFVVTGAVGLGYTFGAQWLLLPLAWLVGDVVFWTVFPHKINAIGNEAHAATLSDVIVHNFPQAQARTLKKVVSFITLVCLAGYVSAQWLAGEKFLNGAFNLQPDMALVFFAGLIVIYTVIGGFRGSVYVDSLQAIIRVIGTTVAITAVLFVAMRTADFESNISAAGSQFLTLLPSGSIIAAIAFVGGFAAASLGFGLGQPQIVTRYLAGQSPKETRAAWWIYIGFVQFTWITMTIFGMVLRGIIPHISDPETGLSLFFSRETNPILAGIIIADIFATIAATSNSLLVAMGQTATFDLIGISKEKYHSAIWPSIAVLGGATMLISTFLNSSVVTLALSSVSLLGAGLAPLMLIRVLRLRCTPSSAMTAILVGLSTATIWKIWGFDSVINEAAPGIALGFAANFAVVLFSKRSSIVS